MLNLHDSVLSDKPTPVCQGPIFHDLHDHCFLIALGIEIVKVENAPLAVAYECDHDVFQAWTFSLIWLSYV